ncbi:hypothetical protein [Nonomuraea bangladeshensis]|uniref:hypothetical protein n=1 Tax=Nonomuraea bangladeshensis TaxID=404385 RepID=UPI0031E33CD7
MTLSSAIGSLPSWHRDAACGPLGKLWASKHPLDVERQRKVCAGCPALHRCAADAAGKRKDELPDLVVAGLTRAEHLAGGLADAPRECSQCHETKPLPDFYARKRGKGGRSSKCKTCENARQRAAYQERVERKRAAYQARKKNLTEGSTA